MKGVIMPGFTSIFNFNQTNEMRFDRLQRSSNKLFAGMERLRNRFNKNQKELKDFVTRNDGARVLPDSAANRAARRRLKNRKRFTVLVDTLLSINALNLVLDKTIAFRFTPQFNFVLALLLSYGLLSMAIEYRIDYGLADSNGFISQIRNRFAYILPLLFIPVMSLFLILTHQGDPVNFIWFFFLIIGFGLNLMVASFSSQYDAMEQSDEVNKKLQTFEKEHEKIGDKIEKTMGKISAGASEMYRLWQLFPDNNKPKLFIFPEYLYFLNTRIFKNETLTIPDLVIVNRPKELAGFRDFWDSFKKSNSPAIENNNPKIAASAPTPKLQVPEVNPEVKPINSVNYEPPILNEETEAGNAPENDEGPGKDIPDDMKWI
jgi:hypothetical protein